MRPDSEAIARFPCFGSTCAVYVSGTGAFGGPEPAVRLVRRRLLGWQRRFSRFEPASELSLLNDDPRTHVPASPTMCRFVDAVVHGATESAGLVDATLLEEIENAGYTHDLRSSLPPEAAFELAPPRKPASAAPGSRWREIGVDRATRTITRPPGVKLDSGGLAKGLFADLVATSLAGYASFAVDCAGDLRIGGAAAAPRAVDVSSPFDDTSVHRYVLVDSGIATSGIGRRSWLDRRGAPAHHLLDPATGRPAFTGVVQATALAPTALTAEILAKAALLSGPSAARRWLRHGGVLFFEDRSWEIVEPSL